jgi:hypothetical protein
LNISTFVPSVDALNKNSMQYFGLLGDYVGGVVGTLIGVLTLVVVFFAWRVSKNSEYRSRTFQIFSEMVKTHEEIVSSLRINTYVGRDAFVQLLSEFYAIYRIVCEEEKSCAIPALSIDEKIDVAYTFMYYGTQILALTVLEDYDATFIKSVADRLSAEKQSNKNHKRTYSGHQNRLSHYFRNIFGAYSFIETSKLDEVEKLALGKVLRTKLSNYEQSLLALNIISHLGRDWETSGLVGKYEPIKNIPIKFFTFDRSFHIKERFPYVAFEWENHGPKRIRVWKAKVGSLAFFAHRVVRHDL